jgi:hypothetical protein
MPLRDFKIYQELKKLFLIFKLFNFLKKIFFGMDITTPKTRQNPNHVKECGSQAPHHLCIPREHPSRV